MMRVSLTTGISTSQSCSGKVTDSRASAASIHVPAFYCMLTILSMQAALAGEKPTMADSPSAFELDPALIDTLQFSRVEGNDLQLTDDYDLRTEVSFKLHPAKPNFSRAGGYGLNMFGTPKMQVRQQSVKDAMFGEAVPDLHEGFAYSAGVRIEHNDESVDSTAFVSSSLLTLYRSISLPVAD